MRPSQQLENLRDIVRAWPSFARTAGVSEPEIDVIARQQELVR